MSLGVPGLDRPESDAEATQRKHIARITTLVDEATRKFEQKLESIGVLPIARASGWIEEYRQQVLGVALEVLNMVRK